MSFILEPVKTSYYSDNNIDTTVLPYHYMASHSHIGSNSNGIHTFQNNQTLDINNNSVKPIELEVPWYQPGASDNQSLLDAYSIQTNQQYRKYMTNNSKEIREFNSYSNFSRKTK